jgi:hopanoid biosynthesis associated RND transporter like protein HpnN
LRAFAIVSTRIGKLGRAALVRWVVLVSGRPWLALALVAALAAGALYVTATGLSINTSTLDMLSPELPFRRNALAVDAAFPQRDEPLTVVVEAASAEAADAAAEHLAAALRARPQLFRTVFYPQSDPFFRRNGLLYLELDALQDLADDLASMQPLLASLKNDPSLRGLAAILELALDQALAEDAAALAPALDAVAAVAAAGPAAAPLSWRNLTAQAEGGAEALRRFIAVQPVLDFGGFAPAGPALEAIEALAAGLPGASADAVRVRVTGEPAMRQDELIGLADSMGLVSLVSLTLVVVLLAAGLRALRLIVPTVAALLVGLALTAGFAALAVGELNLISVAFAVLFIGLSVDFGIHFALRYREEALSGRDHGAALAAAAEGVGGALGLSALAAAIGFFSFLPTSYRGLSELGLISGAGMFVALFCNLTVLPALLSLMPLAGGAGGRRGSGLEVSRIGAHFADRIGRHPRVVVGIAIVLAVAAAPALLLARFDDDPLNLRDPRSPSVAVLLELLDDPRLEPYTADVLAADLGEAAALAARLEALPEVTETATLADLVPPEQEAKVAVIDDMSLFLAPLLLPAPPMAPPDEGERGLAARDLRAVALSERTGEPRLAAAAARLAAALAPLEGDAAGLARFEALVFAHLPELFAGLEESLLAAPFTEAELPDDLRARWVAADGRALVEVRPAEDLRGQAARRAFVAAVQSVAPAASGAPVVITEAGRAVIAAFQEAAVIAIAAIAALLLVLLRRVGVVALVLAPLVLAALLTVAAGLIFGLPFNFANVIVLPLLFGLGVAGGLHIVLRAGQSAPGGVLATSTPRAVLFSALTTVGSFGALALSRHSGTASMGLLLTLAIGLTMASTLIVLPALLHALEARREARRPGPRPEAG